MQALTVRQPYAWMMLVGLKRNEYRSWPIPSALVGQWVALHAGATPADIELDGHAALPDHFPLGAMVGLVRFGASVPALAAPTLPDDGHPGSGLAWPVLECRSLPVPLPCRGALGFWTVPEPIARACDAFLCQSFVSH